MSDPERLQQLRRQRAAIAQHLAWLDQEIKRAAKLPERDVPAPSASNSAAPTLVKLTPAVPLASAPPKISVQLEANNPSPALTADPDDVLEEWTETTGHNNQSDQPISRMGCWLIFATIAAISIGSTGLFIYLFYG